MAIENNYEEWKEIRGRVDSISSAIFLIAGGALSISISIMLTNKASGLITPDIASKASTGWYLLMSSIILMLFLKFNLVFIAFMLQFNTAFVNKNLRTLNGIGWLIGVSGFALFVCGVWFMISAATCILNS